MLFFVYRLTFANGKIYIGMSRTDKKGLFTGRFRGHARDAKNGSENPVHKAWRKHGAPSQVILSFHRTRDECAVAEIEAIQAHDALNSAKGYNLMAGGQGLNVVAGSELYELMRERVWNNPERKAKLSAALKGRKPSAETTAAYKEWAASPEGKARKADVSRQMWDQPGHRQMMAAMTKAQMTDEAREHLSAIHKGRADPRSAEGKQAQREKVVALMNSPTGKALARKAQAAMWSSEENRLKVKAATDKWRASDRNKAQCKQMALMAAAKCAKRVKDLQTGIEYESQRAMAAALGLSDAAITLRVKAGKAIRI